ncbi:MAG: cysteine hydrolase family protein [Trueperaceae bacterium]
MMEKAALILIDVQKGFDDPHWGERNNPGAEKNIARLLETWRAKKRPVIHVKHDSVEEGSPLRLDSSGNTFKPEGLPRSGEPIFSKTVNSAFIGTNLENYLRERGFDTLVIAGLTTDHCVSTSTRMAGNLGFEVFLVGDACATFAKKTFDGQTIPPDEVHHVNLASLHEEFCTVVSTQNVLASL